MAMHNQHIGLWDRRLINDKSISSCTIPSAIPWYPFFVLPFMIFPSLACPNGELWMPPTKNTNKNINEMCVINTGHLNNYTNSTIDLDDMKCNNVYIPTDLSFKDFSIRYYDVEGVFGSRDSFVLLVSPEKCAEQTKKYPIIISISINPDFWSFRSKYELFEFRRNGRIIDVNSFYTFQTSKSNWFAIPIEFDHFQIFCGRGDSNSFSYDNRQYFVQDIRDPTLEHIANAKRDKSACLDESQIKLLPNIFFFIIDCVSRAHFLRSLPKVSSFLARDNPDFAVFQFFRYHAVGLNTNPNMQALFYMNRDNLAYYYEKQGYLSSHLLCICDTHPDYFRNYHVLVESAFCDKEFDEDKSKLASNGVYGIGAHCIAKRHAHTYALDYFDSLISNYNTTPQFSVSHFNEGHEPFMRVTNTLDDDFLSLMSAYSSRPRPVQHNCKSSHSPLNLPLSKTSISVLMADHGTHYFYKNLPAGSIEHALPALFLIMPRSLLRLYPDLEGNLRANEQSLFTPYDLGVTFKHLSQLNFIQEIDQFGSLSGPSYTLEIPDIGHTVHNGITARSLLNRIPVFRSCKDASIPEKYCQCKE